MSPTWLIAEHHFRETVFRRGYLLTLLSLPLFIAFIIGMSRLAASVGEETIRLGVVDPGNFVSVTEVPGRDDDIEILFFDTEESALAALQAEDAPLHGVYLLPADFPANQSVQLIVEKDLDNGARSFFNDLLRTNLLDKNAPDLTIRVIEGSNLLVRATESKREFPASNPTADLFFPLIAAIIFVFTIFPITGIMAGALGSEKVNRTIEVLITSVSPRELIGGKILAVTVIALLQITVWTLFVVFAIWFGGTVMDLSWLQGLQVPWRDIGVIALLAIPGFLFFGSLLMLAGSLIDDGETLQQIGGLMSLPLFMPMYALPAILNAPEGTVSLVFSLLPFSNVLTLGFVSIFQQIPVWKVAASFAISLASGLGLVWLAARAFRFGMLSFGKRIRLRQLISRKTAEVSG